MDPEEYPEYWRPFLHANRERIDKIMEGLHDPGWRRLPAKENVFAALRECEMPKVVIIGQDPYPTPGLAQGLSFSLPDGISIPANNSLRNMLLELERQGFPVPKMWRNKPSVLDPEKTRYRSPTGDLTSWAHQGFLLLNASLTVLPGKAGSDMKVWKELTQDIIRYVAQTSDDEDPGCCFVLWGNFAKTYKGLIGSQHLILEGAHPSPMSAHLFRGNDHFQQITNFLKERYGEDMRWDPSEEK